MTRDEVFIKDDCLCLHVDEVFPHHAAVQGHAV